MPNRSELPLIYSCSGCSDVAQLANNTAVALDHAGEFEMSCISGVGGKDAKRSPAGRCWASTAAICIAPSRVWKT